GGIDVNDKFTVDSATGNIETLGTAKIDGVTSLGAYDNAGTKEYAVTADADGLTITNGKKFSLGGKDVTDIETGTINNSQGDTATLATTATLISSAQNGTYTVTATTGNTSNGTIKSAINELDTAIGDRSTMTNENGADYTTSLSNQDVASAITQIASNIGTFDPTATTKGNIVTTQTVNQNLALIDNNIGDISVFAQSTTGNLSNSYNPSPATNAKDVATAINNIDKTLGKIHGLYKDGTVNSTHIASTVDGNSNLADGTTVEDHLVSLDNAIGNRQIASSNTRINNATKGPDGSVAKGLEEAGNAIGDMNFASTNYVKGSTDLSGAVRTLDSTVKDLDNHIDRVEKDVNDLRHDFRSGMASLAAMSALVPNPRDCGDTSLSVGTGAYDGHTAVALGGFHYLTDNLLLNAGAAYGNTDDLAYRMGITWSW
ncbi:MAG: YadA-like family protein, partial [Alphaproteobacteria bacterium]|nr:YadA-like family protein [Alphaproteobacteria bacterium]